MIVVVVVTLNQSSKPVRKTQRVFFIINMHNIRMDINLSLLVHWRHKRDTDTRYELSFEDVVLNISLKNVEAKIKLTRSISCGAVTVYCVLLYQKTKKTFHQNNNSMNKQNMSFQNIILSFINASRFL